MFTKKSKNTAKKSVKINIKKADKMLKPINQVAEVEEIKDDLLPEEETFGDDFKFDDSSEKSSGEDLGNMEGMKEGLKLPKSKAEKKIKTPKVKKEKKSVGTDEGIQKLLENGNLILKRSHQKSAFVVDNNSKILARMQSPTFERFLKKVDIEHEEKDEKNVVKISYYTLSKSEAPVEI